MSTTMMAARIVLDGPLPVPAPYGLMSVAQEAPDDAHWRAGAAIRPYPNGVPDANDPCADGTLRIKADPTPVVLPDAFPTFTAYLGDICTASGIGDWNAFKGRANAALAARENWVLERQLVAASFDPGDPSAPTPHLGDDNVTLPNGSTATAAATAVAYLEGAIAATGIDGILHLTKEVVAYLGFEKFRDDRGTLRTATGTRVIVGAGYTGADRPTPEGTPATAAGAGESWIYASGPILYKRDGEVFTLPEQLSEAMDRELNEVVYRAERDLWVGWDAQLQAAVRADWSP